MPGLRTALLFAIGAMLGTAPSVAAQQGPVPVSGELNDYLRFLEIQGKATGPLTFQSFSAHRAASDTTGLWYDTYPAATRQLAPNVRLIDPIARGVYNSGYPSGMNDGALWSGRGLSGEITGGLEATVGPLTVTLAPTVWWAQNRAFALDSVPFANRSPYAYPWTNHVDLPQRFGPDALAKLDPGQSGVRLRFGKFTTGFSTENMWWGPAVRTPILMSNTAAGFPHVDLGTDGPVSTPIGSVEARVVWGRLTESPYFDTVTSNDHRLFTGVTIGYAPNFLPGLHLGFERVFYQTWTDSLGFHDFFDVIQPFTKQNFADSTNPGGNDRRDQMLGFTARWILPQSGFDVYVEWARNDHAWSWRDFILEPEHSAGTMMGLEKALSRSTRLRVEWMNIERRPTFQVRAEPEFYQHYIVVQGYTQLGQLLGAGTGPGSDTQFLGLDHYSKNGRLGFSLSRTRFDNDAYYRLYATTEGDQGHEVELSLGLSALRFVGPWDLGGTLVLSRELNRYFKIGNDVTNARFEVSIGWSGRKP